MTVVVRFFAVLREKAGTDGFSLTLADGATVADASAELARRFPALEAALARTAFAVNMTKVDGGAVLREGDELALLPPVSGG